MSGTDTSPETSKDEQPNQPGGLTMTDNEPDHIDNLRSQLRYQISLREAQLTTIKNQQAELDRVQRLLGVEMTAADRSLERARQAGEERDAALHTAIVAQAEIARLVQESAGWRMVATRAEAELFDIKAGRTAAWPEARAHTERLVGEREAAFEHVHELQSQLAASEQLSLSRCRTIEDLVRRIGAVRELCHTDRAIDDEPDDMVRVADVRAALNS